MGEATEFFEASPADTREAIMKATYDALSKHGYADLTIQRIGDEFEKSKSLLYHHYDGKDALLIDFLGFMLSRMEETVPIEEGEPADDQLQTALEHVFESVLEESRDGFNRALTELRAQAAHDDDYRQQFTDNDAHLHARLTELVRAGIEEGVFRDVDPEATASVILTLISGAGYRQSTTDDVDLDAIRRGFETYVRTHLLAEDR